MLLEKKKDYTYLFITKCLKILLNNYYALIIIILIITFNNTLLLATLFTGYKYIGIHIFDFNSLTSLLHTDFWAHTLNILSLFIVFSFSFIMTTFFKFCLTIIFIKQLQNQKIKLLKSLYLPCHQIKNITQLSLIKIFSYPEYWSYLIDPIEQSKKIKQLLQKKNILDNEYHEYSNPNQMLLFPILVESLTIPEEALQKSKELIENKFGMITKYNYSCNKIRFFISCTVTVIYFIIINFIFKFNVFFTIFSIIYTIILFFHIIEVIKLLFSAIIYNYCVNNTIEYFTKEDLKNMFS